MSNYIKHLRATTSNGIEVVDPIDYPEAGWLAFHEFVEDLDRLDDGDESFCAVDPEQYAEIDENYGVKS